MNLILLHWWSLSPLLSLLQTIRWQSLFFPGALDLPQEKLLSWQLPQEPDCEDYLDESYWTEVSEAYVHTPNVHTAYICTPLAAGWRYVRTYVHTVWCGQGSWLRVYVAVGMLSISHCTVDCNSTMFRPQRSLSGTKLFCTWQRPSRSKRCTVK